MCTTDIAQVLPDYVIEAMREALPTFGRKIKGYDMPDELMTEVETRTSSPLRISRGEDLQSLNTPACSRPAKAPATPAASRWRKRWPAQRIDRLTHFRFGHSPPITGVESGGPDSGLKIQHLMPIHMQRH